MALSYLSAVKRDLSLQFAVKSRLCFEVNSVKKWVRNENVASMTDVSVDNKRFSSILFQLFSYLVAGQSTDIKMKTL